MNNLKLPRLSELANLPYAEKDQDNARGKMIARTIAVCHMNDERWWEQIEDGDTAVEGGIKMTYTGLEIALRNGDPEVGVVLVVDGRIIDLAEVKLKLWVRLWQELKRQYHTFLGKPPLRVLTYTYMFTIPIEGQTFVVRLSTEGERQFHFYGLRFKGVTLA